jgi:glycerol uptake facilitator-like aquaporin
MDYAAEFVGTYAFVSIVLLSKNPVVIGLSLVLILSALAAYSKQSVNPAVSIAYALNGQLSTPDAMGYILSQLLAGVLAYFTYRFYLLASVA